MKVVKRIKSLPNYLRSRNKMALVAGMLLVGAAIIFSIFLSFPIIELIEYPESWLLEGTTTNNFFDGLIAAYLLRLLPFSIVFVMFLNAYTLLESHSFGIKIALVLAATFLIAAVFNYIEPNIAFFNVAICIVAAGVQFIQKRTSNTKDNPTVTESVAKVFLCLSGFVCVGALAGLIAYITVRGIGYVSWDFITGSAIPGGYAAIGKCIAMGTPEAIGGISDPIIGSLLIVTVCEAIAVPLGIGAAIYLAEYAPKSRFVEIIRFFTETLAGMPSIVLGIFGAAIFVYTLDWGYSVASGGASLALMILPWNIRVTEEAMRSVPQAYREAAYALGATKWQTIRKAVLLPASPGTITGLMIGLGAAIGETAVLLWTLGQAASAIDFNNLTLTKYMVPSLATWIYGAYQYIVPSGVEAIPGINLRWEAQNVAYAAALVLIVMFLIVTGTALIIRNHLAKKTGTFY